MRRRVVKWNDRRQSQHELDDEGDIVWWNRHCIRMRLMHLAMVLCTCMRQKMHLEKGRS